MNQILEQMLKQYQTQTVFDKKNALKEVVQEIVLCGLSRSGFFRKSAFYGGTALRIFYDLDRFSEDLDFSLKVPDHEFDLADYLSLLDREIRSYGLNFKIEAKEKSVDSDIKSAFLKGNTKEHLLLFYADERLIANTSSNELIKVKFEVDTNPPDFASFETKYRLLPMPYEVCLYDLPSLFAGKIHAVLCRSWRSRVKGRDLYDYVFYLSKGVQVNLAHAGARLIQTGNFSADKSLTLVDLQEMLHKRFQDIDYQQAKQDVLPFIKNPNALDLWGPDFFISITEKLDFQ